MKNIQVSFTPTPEWKQEDRMSVAVRIAAGLHELAEHGFVDPNLLLDATERIQLVLTAHTSLLEADRKHILEGQVLPVGKIEKK